MAKAARYPIEITDVETGGLLILIGAEWTDEERIVAIAQIRRPAGLPDDNGPARSTKASRER